VSEPRFNQLTGGGPSKPFSKRTEEHHKEFSDKEKSKARSEPPSRGGMTGTAGMAGNIGPDQRFKEPGSDNDYRGQSTIDPRILGAPGFRVGPPVRHDLSGSPFLSGTPMKPGVPGVSTNSVPRNSLGGSPEPVAQLGSHTNAQGQGRADSRDVSVSRDAAFDNRGVRDNRPVAGNPSVVRDEQGRIVR
jgi:hypothetical protein